MRLNNLIASPTGAKGTNVSKLFIFCTQWVRTPHQIIRIAWEVNGASGSTECEAWRGQHEIEGLERAGYRILAILPVTGG